MPKKPASKSATASRKPPSNVELASRARSQPRSAGNREITSRPSKTRSHNASGVVTPPGYRQPMPTIAIGSSVAIVAARTSIRCAPPNSSSRRCWDSVVAVG
jgi:hypothetical protein